MDVVSAYIMIFAFLVYSVIVSLHHSTSVLYVTFMDVLDFNFQNPLERGLHLQIRLELVAVLEESYWNNVVSGML